MYQKGLTTTKASEQKLTSWLSAEAEASSQSGANRTTRIVGGEVAPQNKYKFFARYGRKRYGEFCGGSLVDSNWVLTAAHCCNSENVRYGEYVRVAAYHKNYHRSSTEEAARWVGKKMNHPDYNAASKRYDVCMLKTSSPVENIDPIPLADGNKLVLMWNPPPPLTVIGLGTLRSGGGSSPDTLRQVTIDVVKDWDCKQRGYGRRLHTTSMMCAGRPGKDSCQGDSGGPLIFQKGGEYKQVGVVSWGIGCAYRRYPGIYFKVTEKNLRPFIDKGIRVIVERGGPRPMRSFAAEEDAVTSDGSSYQWVPLVVVASLICVGIIAVVALGRRKRSTKSSHIAVEAPFLDAVPAAHPSPAYNVDFEVREPNFNISEGKENDSSDTSDNTPVVL